MVMGLRVSGFYFARGKREMQAMFSLSTHNLVDPKMLHTDVPPTCIIALKITSIRQRLHEDGVRGNAGNVKIRADLGKGYMSNISILMTVLALKTQKLMNTCV